jgi:hypothetical protein
MARNTNRQGADFELEIMHYLAGCACEAKYARPRHVGWRGFGYDCLRSSGSRGAVDVVAVPDFPYPKASGRDRLYDADMLGDTHLPPLFIQAKITNPLLSPAERRNVRGLALRAGALPLVAYKAKDETTGRVRPHFRLLTGPGPKDWTPWEPGDDA